MTRAAAEAAHMSAPDHGPHRSRRFLLLLKGRPHMSQRPLQPPRARSTDPFVRGRQRAVVAVAGRLTRLGGRIGTRWGLLGFGQSAQLVLEVEGVVLFVNAQLNRLVSCQRIRAIYVSLAALVEVIG